MLPASPAVDYRKLRPGNLNSPEFCHLKLLLYWPIYGLMFLFVERFYPVESYHVVYCFLDDWIPFNEWFLIPYLFWFLFLVGIHLYTLLYDVEAFRKLMRYVMGTFTFCIVIYLVFPNCQQMRPAEFARDNVLTRFLAGLYRVDTSTNVCPSLHVVGALGVMFAAWHSKGLEAPGWKAGFSVAAVLISVSTVFLKQHSVIDVAAAIPISLGGYWLCFLRKGKRCRT